MPKELIRLANCTMAFDGEVVLNNINLYINDQEFLTLLGPSGCGKTTTLRIIGGFQTPTQGDVFFDGVRINDVPPHKRTINTVFQRYALFPHLNVFENIAFGLRIPKTDSESRRKVKLPESEIQERVLEMLKVVNLKGFEKRAVSSLSGGQQQRVAIARALACDPEYILCDEATSALDPASTNTILKLLRDINRTTGVTIIVITHEMAVIEEICQRVAIIDSSRIAEVGTVDEVFTRPKSAMAKQLIYPDGKRNSLATGKRYCRIVFDGNSSFEPVVSNMVLECKAPVNIMFADTKNIDGKAYGQMILQLPEDERAAKRALAYLETQNVHAEEVADYASV